VNASFNYYKEDFIADIKRVTGDFVNSSLLLSGASSTGKTFLMAAICNDLLIRQGVPANEMYYINVIELFAEIGADITQFESIVSHCAEVRYLFLDEVIPAKTEWEHRALYLILERRRNNSLVTISTTNYDTQKLDGQIVSRLLDLNGIHYSMTRKCWS
jgi:DNA replication protein DnaC